MTSSKSFGQRRFDVGCGCRANIGTLFYSLSVSSLSNPVSSIYSHFLFRISPGNCGRPERSETCCVAAVEALIGGADLAQIWKRLQV